MNHRWIAALPIVVALLVPSAGLAHEGHAHKFMGTILTLHEKQIEEKTTEGKTVTFNLDAKTVYTRGKTKVDAAHITVGERVVVSALEVPAGKTMTAQSVQLAAAPAAAAR